MTLFGVILICIFFIFSVFKDPAAFDFLLNCGNSTTGANSGVPTRDFGKESLFVKFDPLVSRLPQGVRPGRETDLQSRIEESPTRKVNGELFKTFILCCVRFSNNNYINIFQMM